MFLLSTCVFKSNCTHTVNLRPDGVNIPGAARRHTGSASAMLVEKMAGGQSLPFGMRIIHMSENSR